MQSAQAQILALQRNVGNRAVQRMLASRRDSASVPSPAQPAAHIQRDPTRTPRPQCRNGRLTRQQYLRGVTWLEENNHITSEEAAALAGRVPDSRRQRCRLIAALERQATRGREVIRRPGSGRRSARLITDFAVTPREIRVDEGESARISFNVNGSDIASISCFILKYEFSSEETTARFFHFRPTTGHKNAIWDGTWSFVRRSPPEPGVYRVRVMVRDRAGNAEEAFEQIRVHNDSQSTVLPRTESGLALRSLNFNGRQVVLTDERGNEIRARAVSGLRPNNPRNRQRVDYTDPQHECVRDRGPIPRGQYFIDANSVQEPALARGRLRYPSGAGAGGWGPFRVPLRPAAGAAPCGRTELFFHLDVTNDGTAGCIGVSSQDEAKFNQMIALMMRIPAGSALPVNVNY